MVTLTRTHTYTHTQRVQDYYRNLEPWCTHARPPGTIIKRPLVSLDCRFHLTLVCTHIRFKNTYGCNGAECATQKQKQRNERRLRSRAMRSPQRHSAPPGCSGISHPMLPHCYCCSWRGMPPIRASAAPSAWLALWLKGSRPSGAGSLAPLMPLMPLPQLLTRPRALAGVALRAPPAPPVLLLPATEAPGWLTAASVERRDGCRCGSDRYLHAPGCTAGTRG